MFFITHGLWTWFDIGATHDLFGSVYERHPGLTVLARRTMLAAALGAVIVTLLLQPLTRSSGVWNFNDYRFWRFAIVEIHRLVAAACLIFTIVMLAKLLRMPLRLSRAERVHSVLWCIRLVTSTVFIIPALVWWSHPEVRLLCNLAILSSAIGLNVAWMHLVRYETLQPSVVLKKNQEGVSDDDVIAHLVSFRCFLETASSKALRHIAPR